MPSESMSSTNNTLPASSVQSYHGTPASGAVTNNGIVTSVSGSQSLTSKSSRKPSESRVIAPANGQNTCQVSAATFLSVAPQQAYYSHPGSNPGLTVASVQQQLQPGSVVFTSPTMAMALTGTNQQQTGPGSATQMAQQQPLVVGQAMGQLQGFNPNNGQPQMIQTQQMGMIPQVQVIGGNGQYFQPFYTNVNGQPVGQPMLLANNLTMIPAQNPGQPGLAIQIPNGTNGTMINQLGQQTPTTPVKNNQPQQILKISPQQQTTNKNNGQQGNRQSQAQQSNLLQPTTFQQGPSGNQTFVISPYNGQANTQNGILPNTPTNQRKTSGSGRTSSSGNKASGMIQKIQPATNNLTTTPLLAPAQFKTTTAQFATPTNQNSPANSQTIMVHGQNIQPGNGGIQLGGQIIPQVASFQTQFQSPGITWAGQQQLVAAGPGQFYIRAPGGNDQHMIIQTSNNQFQTVQMQMGAQQPGQATGAMQMQQGGQQIVATSINQQLPISIQAHQGVSMASTQMMAPQPIGSNLMSVASTTVTSATITTVTNAVNTSTPTTSSNVKQRLIRPANPTTTSTPTSSNSTSTTTSAKKPTEQNRVSTNGTAKLAPKSVTVSNTLARSSPSLSTQAKLPLPVLPKLTDSSTLVSSTVSTTMTTSTSATSTVGTKTTLALRVSTTSINSNISATSATSSGTNTLTSQHSVNGTSLVTTNTTTTTTPKSTPSPMTLNKNVNRKSQPEKRDSSIATDSKGLSMSLPLPQNKVKLNGLRPQGKNMPSLSTPPLGAPLPANTQMINGVPCQIPTKNSVTNNGLTGSKPQTPSTTKPQPASTTTTKKKNSNKVLTHCIDGYVFQESTFPFPVGGYEKSEQSDLNGSGVSNEKVEEASSQVTSSAEESKENKSVVKGVVEQIKQPEARKNLCLQCNKRERMQTVRKRLKRFCSQSCCDEYWALKQKLQNASNSQNGNTPSINGGSATKRPLAAQTQTAHFQDSKRPKTETTNGISMGTSTGGDSINDDDMDESIEPELSQVWLPYEGKKSPDEWTVSDVKEFIQRMFPNMTEISNEFESQDIDGRALMLIKEDHIIDILNIKLGPALKLGSKLKLLKKKYKIK